MPPVSRLGRQLQEAIACLERAGSSAALIGGLALARYKVVRATHDVDLLAEALRTDDIDRELLAVGYVCLYRSPDAATYVRGDERVDLLYASRPADQRWLDTADEVVTPFGTLRVVQLAGLESLSSRVVAPRAPVPTGNPYQRLDDLMAVVEALCPVWPQREIGGPMNDLRL